MLGVLVAGAAIAGCSDRTSERDVAAAVRVEATGCRSRPSVGAGSFVSDRLVLTVAHVVAGSDGVQVELADGTTATARVVAIDRSKDLALLDVDLEQAPAHVDIGHTRPGERGEFVVWRDGSPVEQSFEVATFVDINASDIDHSGSGLRKGFQIEAQVANGDSGSLLVRNGTAVGVIFARSTGDDDRAWATDIREARPLFDVAANGQAVDVGRCVG
ncbi:MAG: hypothetical protein RL238_563 [Actinomycetota bacterium]|jgi:S1-C subfamily serine protease